MPERRLAARIARPRLVGGRRRAGTSPGRWRRRPWVRRSWCRSTTPTRGTGRRTATGASRVVEVGEERADDVDARRAGVDPRPEVGERRRGPPGRGRRRRRRRAARRGSTGRDGAVVAGRGDDDGWRRRAVAIALGHRAAGGRSMQYVPNAITTMSMSSPETRRMARSMAPDDRGVVAVAVARQHAAVVDEGVGARLADDAADERAVAGLDVEAAEAVVVGFVLVVPAPGPSTDRATGCAGRSSSGRGARHGRRGCAGRCRAPARSAAPTRESPALARSRPAVEPGERSTPASAAAPAAGRACRVEPGVADDAEVPGHAVGEVHVVAGDRRDLVAQLVVQLEERARCGHRVRRGRRRADPSRSAPRPRRGPGAVDRRRRGPAARHRGSRHRPPRTRRRRRSWSTSESGRSRNGRPRSSAATAMRRRDSASSNPPSGPSKSWSVGTVTMASDVEDRAEVRVTGSAGSSTTASTPGAAGRSRSGTSPGRRRLRPSARRSWCRSSGPSPVNAPGRRRRRAPRSLEERADDVDGRAHRRRPSRRSW